MKTARVELDGVVRIVRMGPNGQLQAEDQSELLLDRVRWLPPTTGTVFGVALNYQGLLEQWLPRFEQAPYVRPPKAPVLFIKPENTQTGHLSPIPFPSGEAVITAGPALGVVMGRSARRVSENDAMAYVGGYTLVNEVSLPETDYYRPQIKAKCRDGFCPMGPFQVASTEIPDPHGLTLRTWVNGVLRQESDTGRMVWRIPQLIAHMSQFITLEPGDLIITGTPEGRAALQPGDQVAIEIEGLGRLENPVVANQSPGSQPKT